MPRNAKRSFRGGLNALVNRASLRVSNEVEGEREREREDFVFNFSFSSARRLLRRKEEEGKYDIANLALCVSLSLSPPKKGKERVVRIGIEEEKNRGRCHERKRESISRLSSLFHSWI